MSLLSDDGNFVVNVFIAIEVEGLKCVKKKITHVLIHIDANDSSIEIVDDSATIHDLHLYSQHGEREISKNRRKM